ncbi:MAG: hypothetical protein NTX86_02175 [Candidatus Dependentiae bacterium]|nr:hypothetical protein [Candidatus Dependentiae bacterium]
MVRSHILNNKHLLEQVCPRDTRHYGILGAPTGDNDNNKSN